METILTALAIVVVVIWVWRTRKPNLPSVPDTPETLYVSVPEPITVAGPDPAWFGDAPGTVFPGPKARLWATARLYDEGVDADADTAYAAELLRTHEPRLTREEADKLIRSLL